MEVLEERADELGFGDLSVIMFFSSGGSVSNKGMPMGEIVTSGRQQ
jgi:hypothetical protein